MDRPSQLLTIVALALTLAASGGCATNRTAARTEEREQERVAMQLEDLTRQRDTFKAELDRLRATNSKTQEELTAARKSAEQANLNLARASRDLDSAKSSGDELRVARDRVRALEANQLQLESELKQARERITQLEAIAGATVPATRPAGMNK